MQLDLYEHTVTRLIVAVYVSDRFRDFFLYIGRQASIVEIVSTPRLTQAVALNSLTLILLGALGPSSPLKL